MSLTVHQALDLEAMERFKLVAGIGGLNNQITRAGIIDHEDGQTVSDTVIAGEFLFGNFMLIRNEPDKIIDYVKRFIDSNVACFAMKTIFFKEFPSEVIEYANKHKFPLFTFDETYIEDIILDIDNALHIQRQMSKLQNHVDDMISHPHDEIKARSSALKLNRSFSPQYMAASLAPKLEALSLSSYVLSMRRLLSTKSAVLEHEGTILVLASFPPKKRDVNLNEAMSGFMSDLFQSCGIRADQWHIGQSLPKTTLGHMGLAILESKYALEFAHIRDEALCSFDGLGIYRTLIPLRSDPWLMKYYEDMVHILIEHDDKNDAELLRTAIEYVDCDANIKETASRLYQHVNTVRYRIRKIYALLGLDDLQGMQYETLALTIHMYRLHTL